MHAEPPGRRDRQRRDTDAEAQTRRGRDTEAMKLRGRNSDGRDTDRETEWHGDAEMQGRKDARRRGNVEALGRG
eukprot:15450959-Alexandrium_andersonii.AAC.1